VIIKQPYKYEDSAAETAVKNVILFYLWLSIQMLTDFSEHKLHLKSFNFHTTIKCPYNAVHLTYESGDAFSPRTNFVVNDAIYLNAGYNLTMSAAHVQFMTRWR